MAKAEPLLEPGASGLPHLDRLVEEQRALATDEPLDRGLVLHALMELLELALTNAAAVETVAALVGLVEESDVPPDNLPYRIGRLVRHAEETGQVDALLSPLVELAPQTATAAGLVRDCYARSRFRMLMAGPPDEPLIQPPGDDSGLRDLPERDDDPPQLVDLRLDTAVPSRVYVGRPFRLAVAVRLPTSPVLERADLPAVESGDLLVEWPAHAAALRLRLHVDAPDCALRPPANESFRLFAGRDGPTLYYLLTPQKRGDIAIVVTVYVEGAEPDALETLGAAGLNTEAVEEEPVARGGPVAAGAVEVHVQSLSLSRLTDPQVVAALLPLRALLTSLFDYDAELPWRLAQRALIETARIERSNVLADQWWLVLVAAHNSGACPALVREAIGEIPERERDLRAALAHYEQTPIPTG
ncbi:MAG: hypothetical protein ACRC1H_06765 [Caldilineaceae bacterium]